MTERPLPIVEVVAGGRLMWWLLAPWRLIDRSTRRLDDALLPRIGRTAAFRRTYNIVRGLQQIANLMPGQSAAWMPPTVGGGWVMPPLEDWDEPESGEK